MIRLCFALACGAAIGAERQFRQRMAGLRTNALVAVGASLFALLAELVPSLRPEGGRIAAQIVSGVGFLGAGVIMRDGLNVRGLNTAATLWCSAAVGVMASMGLLLEAGLGTVVILSANILLRVIARQINRQPASREETELPYRLHIVCNEADGVQVRALVMGMLSSTPLALHALQSRDLDSGDKQEVLAELFTLPQHQPLLEKIVARVSLQKGVSAVSWHVSNHSDHCFPFMQPGGELY